MHVAAVVNADTMLEAQVGRLDPAVRRKYRHAEEARDAADAARTAAFSAWETARQQLVVASGDATVAADYGA